MKRAFIAGVIFFGCLCGMLCLACSHATGHVHDFRFIGADEPTCVTAGIYRYECACGEKYDVETEPAKGHVFDKGVFVEPSCETDGGQKVTCTVCGYSSIDPGTLIPKHFDTDYDGYCNACEAFVEKIIEITNATELNMINNNLSAAYVLKKDIYLSGKWKAIGGNKPFTGKLYGNGHTIRGRSYTSPHELMINDCDYFYSLFTYNRGLIDGLTLENVTFDIQKTVKSTTVPEPLSSAQMISGLAMYNYGVIRNCKIIGSNTYSYSNKFTCYGKRLEKSYGCSGGGFVMSNFGTIDNCTVEGNANSVFSETIEYVSEKNYADSNDWAKSKSDIFFGLIAGSNYGTIRNSDVNCTYTVGLRADAQVSKAGKADVKMDVCVGSFVGYNEGVIIDCKAKSCVFDTQQTAQEECAAIVTVNEAPKYEGLIGKNNGTVDDLDNIY